MEFEVLAIRKQLNENGFGLIENFLSDVEIDQLKAAIVRIIETWDPVSLPKTVFTTDEQPAHAQDRYFLNSSNNISYFYEENALDNKGQLKVEKSVALNKIGHGIHILDFTFKQITFSEKFKSLSKQLGLVDPVVVQSMVIFKQPKIGGKVTPHQDATFLHVQPTKNLLGCWIALEDADESNGCLCFLPGSHTGPLFQRFVRTDKISIDNDKQQHLLLKYEGEKPTEWNDLHSFIPCPVRKGTLVLIDGRVVHYSAPNTSSRSRLAYTFHLIDMHNAEYSPRNWLQFPDNEQFPKLYSFA